MNNSAVVEQYVDPDPTSALFLTIWFTVVGVFGIPLNIFIVVATVKVKEIRAVSSNLFIGSLALSDVLAMLSLSLHLPCALTKNEPLCKVIGVALCIFGILSAYHPPFLALNRYAIVCRQQEKLARILYKAFSRKGTCWMIFFLWTFQFVYQVPYVLYDTLGMHSIGICATTKKSTNIAFIRVYYYCGLLGVSALSNFPLLVFYRKVSLWVRMMSAQLLLSVETKDTLRETESVLHLTKWVTFIPFICTSQGILIAILFEFDSEIVSVGVARLIISPYPLVQLLNAIVTLKYARPYRLALKRVCEKTAFTSTLYSWMIEGGWRNKVDVLYNNQSSVFASRSPIQVVQ